MSNNIEMKPNDEIDDADVTEEKGSGYDAYDGGAIIAPQNTQQYMDPNSPGISAGGAMTGGAMHHKQMYHHLLEMPHREWEAVREAAHQMMGGSPSSMWEDEAGGPLHISDPNVGGAMYIAGGFNHADLKDILLSPTPAAAARLLELEHDTRGSGFKNALNKAMHFGRQLVSGARRYAPQVAKTAEQIGNVASSVGLHGAANAIHGAVNTGKRLGHAAENVLQAGEKVGKNIADTVAAPEKLLDPQHVKESISNARDLINTAKQGVSDIMPSSGGNIHEEIPMVGPGNVQGRNDASSEKGGKMKKKRKGGKMSAEQKLKMKEGRKNKKAFTYGGMKEEKAAELSEPAGGMTIAGNIKFKDPRRRF